MALLALPHCVGLPYWHHQLVSSCYHHQPESHQSSLQIVLELERSRPIDRTPGTPGSDKKSLDRAHFTINSQFYVSKKRACDCFNSSHIMVHCTWKQWIVFLREECTSCRSKVWDIRSFRWCSFGFRCSSCRSARSTFWKDDVTFIYVEDFHDA